MPARRSAASTASRRPARRRSTRSAEALPRGGMTLRFGTDGVRGVANRDLTPELVTALGRAAARVLGADRPFVVGRDTRRSGPLLEAALVAGFGSGGGDGGRLLGRVFSPPAGGSPPPATIRTPTTA